jgi:hypothetical protein
MSSVHVLPRITSEHVLPRIRPGALPEILAGLGKKIVWFSLVATLFVFVSILLTGIHP